MGGDATGPQFTGAHTGFSPPRRQAVKLTAAKNNNPGGD